MRTYFSRMLVTYLTITLGLLLMLGILVSQMFASQYMSQATDEIRREIREINAIMVEKYNYSEKRQIAHEELLTIARKYKACIQVMDIYGGIKTFTDPDNGSMWQDAASVDLAGKVKNVVLGEEMVSTGFFEDKPEGTVMTVGQPLLNNNNIEGAIFFHTSMEGVNASIRGVYEDVALSAVLAIILAVIAVYATARRFTKPVVVMNKIVERYSRGEFDVRVKVITRDEIGQLSESFNSMADTLNNLESMRQSFVANVSHELRSPLASMRGFLEGVLDGTIAKDQRAHYLKIVLDETNRLSELVNNLLDLARMESGEVPLKLSVFDINEMLIRILVTFEPRIDKNNLKVEVKLKQQHCYVEADSDKISQVVRNLIDNAIKFMKPGGTLTIWSNAGRKQAYIAVADTGIGIAKEDIAYIFERFYKAEKAHTPGEPGTGLGLSIVKRIIDQHEQQIRVSSSDKGTRFIFTLKRAAEPKRRERIKDN